VTSFEVDRFLLCEASMVKVLDFVDQEGGKHDITEIKTFGAGGELGHEQDWGTDPEGRTPKSHPGLAGFGHLQDRADCV
jgi:hypothetical protein